MVLVYLSIPKYFTMRLFFILLFPFLLLGQEKAQLTYKQTQDIAFFKSIKNRTSFDSYVTKEGFTLSIGDTLLLAQPSTRSSQAYVYQTGDRDAQVESKEQQRFEFIQFGKRLILRNNQFFSNQSPDAYPTNRLSGEPVIIKEIVAIHKGSRKKPLAVYLILGEQNNRAFGIFKHLTVADVENALTYGEIQLSNLPITRKEALAKLKEAKELLDLEIISEAEYQIVKEKMTSFIKH